VAARSKAGARPRLAAAATSSSADWSKDPAAAAPLAAGAADQLLGAGRRVWVGVIVLSEAAAVVVQQLLSAQNCSRRNQRQTQGHLPPQTI
jgi:hypothetical protein